MSKKIGFIGLGIMGRRMAANLNQAGFELAVFNRTKKKADSLLSMGVKWCDTPAQLAKDIDVLFTMLAHPDAVSQAALGEDGHLDSLKPDTIWVDCSTVNPSFAKEMAKEAGKCRVRHVDAPVFGTKKPAQDGTLAFFAGGEERDVEAIKPYFDTMGSSVKYVGDHGMGASIKMVVNVMLGQNIVMFSEAIALGRSLGLSQDMMFETLLGGPMAAPYLSIKSAKIKEGRYEADFPLKWMHKDLHLVAQTAFESGIPLPSANAVKEVFAKAKQAGLGDKDFAAIFDFIGSNT